MPDQKTVAAMQGNLRILMLLQITRGAVFFFPVWTLYYLEHNLNYTQIFIIESVLALTLAAWQLPSGYLSDRYGRKETLLIACTCYFLGALIFSMSETFWGFLMGAIAFAMNMSFASGSVEALAYESLIESGGEPREFRRLMSRLSFARFFSEAMAAVAATALIIIGIEATFWATILPAAASVLCAFLLTEPRRHLIEESPHLPSLLSTCAQTLKSPFMRSIIFLDTTLTSLCLLLYWFTQPYQQDVGLPLGLFGIMHGGIVLAGAVAARFTHRVEHILSDSTFYAVLAAGIVGSYLLLGSLQSIKLLPLFFLVRIAWGFLGPLTSDILTRSAPASSRATVLSIRGLTFQLLYAPFPPLLGYAADILSLQQAMLIAGITGGLAAATTLLLMRPVWVQVPSPR